MADSDDTSTLQLCAEIVSLQFQCNLLQEALGKVRAHTSAWTEAHRETLERWAVHYAAPGIAIRAALAEIDRLNARVTAAERPAAPPPA
jgi:hypothetical protein